MSLKEAIINNQLPSDDEILGKLLQAKNTGHHPATLIGTLVEGGIQTGSVGVSVLKKYPKTLAFLSDNSDWIIADLERTLKYLKTMSEWLAKN